MAYKPAPITHDPSELDYRLAVPPKRYRGRTQNISLPIPSSFDEADVSDKPSFIRYNPIFRRFTRDDIKDISARYHSRLEAMLAVDDAVKQIVKTLKDTGQLGRTVIIFTSDNGYLNGEHRIRAGKYYAYEPSIRVPLVILGPGLLRGVTQSTEVENIDLAPTILQLAHAKPLRLMDGRSLVPLMRNRSLRWNRDLLLETGENPIYPAVYQGIRTPRYLYVEYSTGDRELYDVETDPDELTNRYNDAHFRKIQAYLHQHLAILRQCAGASCR